MRWQLLLCVALSSGCSRKATTDGASATPIDAAAQAQRTDASVPPRSAPPADPAGMARLLDARVPDLVLSWSKDDGVVDFTIERSGLAHFTAQGNHPGVVVTSDAMLSRTELEELRRTLASHGVCHVKGGSDPPPSEEHERTLIVGFSDLRCMVSMHEGDWSDASADGVACFRALEALAARVGKNAR